MDIYYFEPQISGSCTFFGFFYILYYILSADVHDVKSPISKDIYSKLYKLLLYKELLNNIIEYGSENMNYIYLLDNRKQLLLEECEEYKKFFSENISIVKILNEYVKSLEEFKLTDYLIKEKDLIENTCVVTNTTYQHKQIQLLQLDDEKKEVLYDKKDMDIYNDIFKTQNVNEYCDSITTLIFTYKKLIGSFNSYNFIQLIQTANASYFKKIILYGMKQNSAFYKIAGKTKEEIFIYISKIFCDNLKLYINLEEKNYIMLLTYCLMLKIFDENDVFGENSSLEKKDEKEDEKENLVFLFDDEYNNYELSKEHNQFVKILQKYYDYLPISKKFPDKIVNFMKIWTLSGKTKDAFIKDVDAMSNSDAKYSKIRDVNIKLLYYTFKTIEDISYTIKDNSEKTQNTNRSQFISSCINLLYTYNLDNYRLTLINAANFTQIYIL
jgi:hypothetical protein